MIESTSREVQVPVSDLLAGTEIDRTPAYLQAVRVAATGASAIVLAEPYLRPVIDQLDLGVPVLYDAYNVETALKADAYPDTPLGRSLLAQVAEVERRAVTEAAVVTTCSAADADALAALAGRDLAEVVVVPNGTAIPDAVPSPEDRRRRSERWRRRYWTAGSQQAVPQHLAVFFGSWHPPNLDAAKLLIDVAPLLPDVLILSVGHHGAAFANWVVPRTWCSPARCPPTPRISCSPPPTSPSTRCASARAPTSRSSRPSPRASRWCRPPSGSEASMSSTTSTCAWPSPSASPRP